MQANLIIKKMRPLFLLRWQPGKDLIAVMLSWVLVVGSLYTATVIIGPGTGGGLPYFFLYAVLAATIFGIGIPLGWMVIIRKRPLADLGITRQKLGVSLLLQLVFTALILPGGLSGLSIPAWSKVIPLLGLSLAIGFFEAVFWRGWMLNRLEEAFGFLPAALIGSALYAAYHIGYAMPFSEITFLFFIGLMYAAAFRLTGSIFILWPLFQPSGQLITLIKDGLDLPLIATLGFVEVFIVMAVLTWLVGRTLNKVKKPIIKNPELENPV